MYTIVGLNEVRKQIVGAAAGGAQPAKFNYIGIGTDATAESDAHTALLAEVGTRIQVTDPTFPADGDFDLEAIFPPGNGTGTIREIGLFNASSGGTMLSRIKLTTEKIKTVDESLKVPWLEAIAELVP